MDWKGGIRQRIVKEVNKDRNLIISIKEIAEIKIKSANSLNDDFYIAKISLLYDALRGYLEALALEEGYKIYNHECYTSFLKEILKLSEEAGLFDELRKIRNKINYYGKKFDSNESKKIILDINSLIKNLKKRSFK